MADTVADIISARVQEPEGLSRMIAWSAGAHVVFLTGMLLMPAPSHAPEAPRVVMSISLGGAAGPVTGGQTQMGGRAIEAPPPEVTPPPRPVEAPPPPPAPPAMTTPPPPDAPRRPQQEPQPRRPQQATPPAPTPRRTPFSAEQPRAGSTPVDTGARGTGAGLSTAGGGGSGGVQLDVADFCCPQYLERMVELIQRNWNNQHATTGATTMRFTIQRDGTLDAIRLAQTSGHWALDNAAERALHLTARLPPLPAAFPNPTLTVHLRFEYER
jgi:periplasmic protein TonB